MKFKLFFAMTKFQKMSVPIFIFSDILNLAVAFYISLYFYRINDIYFQDMESIILLGLIALWLIIGYSNKLYVELTGNQLYRLRIAKYLKTYFVLAGIIGLSYLIFSFPKEIRNLFLCLLLGIPSLGIITNFLVVKIYKPFQERKARLSTTLIAGAGELAKKVEGFISSNPYNKLSLQGFVQCGNENSAVGNDRIVTNLDNLKDYLNSNYIDEIIIALSFKDMDNIKSIVKLADYHGTRVRFVPDYKSIFGDRFKSFQYGDLEVVNVRQLPLDYWFPNFVKACFDTLFSGLALVFLAPLFLAIAVLIKLESKGPVFYCPERIGHKGRPFKIVKFRTMYQNDNPQGGTQSTVKDDPRITKSGKFLRKYSLDELPQFLNVLSGEMSVVGPRPHRIYLNKMLQSSEEKYMVRHYYKPGITGWAQVNGWRGPMETPEQKKQRTAHDLWYLNNWSFVLDVKIIYLTIFGSKTHKNAF